VRFGIDVVLSQPGAVVHEYENRLNWKSAGRQMKAHLEELLAGRGEYQTPAHPICRKLRQARRVMNSEPVPDFVPRVSPGNFSERLPPMDVQVIHNQMNGFRFRAI
jgi:hypothetical protein